MEDKERIILGTILCIAFTVLVVIIGIVAFRQLPPLWATLFIVPFAAVGIFADYLVARYFINKLKSRKK